MDVRRDARWASASEGATDMADATTTTRRCIGSARFGIEAHEAPIEDFPHQASQKDGLGRMCRTHWNAYTAGLARDAKARKAGEARDALAATASDAAPSSAEPLVKRRRPANAPAATTEGDAS
jgi:hypothetical protein